MGNTNVDQSAYDTDGYVRITWDNSDEAGGHEAWRIYRRDNDAGTAWELIKQVDSLQTNYTYDDYLAPSNRDVDYAVVEVTTGNTEGAYTPVATVPVATNYWLIDSGSTSYSFRLEHVTDDSFDEEHEEDIIKLIGRGRKKEIGTRWGFVGSLDIEIRPKNGKTSVEQYTELRNLKERQNNNVYLRTPFGDVFQIAIGKLSNKRVPGSGTDMWLDVTIPYEEVA